MKQHTDTRTLMQCKHNILTLCISSDAVALYKYCNLICSATTDMQCATFTVTWSLTLIRALVAVSWTTATQFWSAWQEHCSVGCNQYLTPRLDWCSVLSHKIRTRNAAPPSPSLVKGTRADPVSYMCSYLPLPSRHRATSIPGWNTLHLSSSVKSRRRLHSRSTSTLLVPTTLRTTLGNRTFPVALHGPGMLCRRLSEHLNRTLRSGDR